MNSCNRNQEVLFFLHKKRYGVSAFKNLLVTANFQHTTPVINYIIDKALTTFTVSK